MFLCVVLLLDVAGLSDPPTLNWLCRNIATQLDELARQKT